MIMVIVTEGRGSWEAFCSIMEHLKMHEHVFPCNHLFSLPAPNYQTYYKFLPRLKVFNKTYATHFLVEFSHFTH